MNLRVSCPQCGLRFQVNAKFAGRRGKCPQDGCTGRYVVPVFDQAGTNSHTPEPRPVESLRQKSVTQHRSISENLTRPQKKPTRKYIVLGMSLLASLVLLAAIFIATYDIGIEEVQAGQVETTTSPTAQPGDKSDLINPAAARRFSFEADIRPFFKKYCFDCHGPDEMMEGYAFHRYSSVRDIHNDRKTWEHVYRILKSGAMPPDDYDPRPTRKETEAIAVWLHDELIDIDCNLVSDPGRVTIRRLNRTEYDNTIRDLVGVNFSPSEDFPSDDVGHGFDNIGDVLSISPLLLEKYLDAAEQISERAIDTEAAEPFAIRKTHDGLKNSFNNRWRDGGIHFLHSNGEIYSDINFPHSGEYRVRVEAGADQAGDENAKMELRLNGKAFKTFEVTGRREVRKYEATVKVSSGKARLAAAFINDYYQPNHPDRNKRDRNLFVRLIEVNSLHANVDKQLSDTHRRIITVRPGASRSVREAATTVLRNFANRAFRRPATEEEIGRYVDLVELAMEKGDNYDRGIQFALQAILVSPHFLFRVERDPNPNDPRQTSELNQYELATRLSYFLWSSMPDDELLNLAKAGLLSNNEILHKQIHRMLADSKSDSLVDDFAVQWLNLRRLPMIVPDPRQFPDYDEVLQQDMQRETELVFDMIKRENRSVFDLLTTNQTFVNERLARHYGIPNVHGNTFQRVQLPEGKRLGILTHASILTLTSNPTRTSPVKRGKWIMENILGEAPPDPPDDVPELEETQAERPNLSLREQLAIHRENATCASCHDTMDAIGLAFENYNVIGAWREKDGKHDVDATGQLPGGKQFDGAVELVRILDKRDFARCLTEKLMTFALGRGLEYYDKCTVDRIVEKLMSDNSRFETLITAIVASDAFRRRRGEGDRSQ